MIKKLLYVVAILSSLPFLKAQTVDVPFDASWSQSSVVIADSGVGVWVDNLMTPPPADSTFTESVSLGGNSVVNADDAADIGGSAFGFLGDIRYVRKTFNLDPFDSVTASVEFSVDNGLAVWINGSFVAAETSFTVENWSSPYPKFEIDSSGGIINTEKIDESLPFTGFLVGENEVIVAVRNIPSPDAGAAAFNMQVNAVQSVPEPSSVLLCIVSFGGLCFRRIRC